MGKDSVADMERILPNTATDKLKEIRTIRINKILLFIQFLETIDELVADNPTQWKKLDLRQWHRDRKPSNVTTTTVNLPPTGATSTAAQTKQQQIDDDMLMGWKRARKDAKGYPELNED